MNLPFFIYQIAFLVVCSLLIIKKGRFNIVIFFFFVSLLIVESVCYFWLINKIRNTNEIYNWWFPFEFIFYGFFLIKGNPKNKHFKLTAILSSLYIAATIVYYIIAQNQRFFSTIIYEAGELYLLFLIALKIKELLKHEFQENPFKNSAVWLVIGLLLSNLGSLLHLSSTNYLELHNIHLLNALRKLNIILTEILYFCVMIYFFIEWKKPKSNI